MTTTHPTNDPRLQAAFDELRGLILERYPEATFQVCPAEDDRRIAHLITTVDVEDTDEVLDVVIDRMLQMQIDEGLPIYVVPVRPLSRVIARRAALAGQPAKP